MPTKPISPTDYKCKLLTEYHTQWRGASEKSTTQTDWDGSPNSPRQMTSPVARAAPNIHCADRVHRHKLRKKPSISGQERQTPLQTGECGRSLPFFFPLFSLSAAFQGRLQQGCRHLNPWGEMVSSQKNQKKGSPGAHQERGEGQPPLSFLISHEKKCKGQKLQTNINYGAINTI